MLTTVEKSYSYVKHLPGSGIFHQDGGHPRRYSIM